jgi:hypothetical protein
MTTYIPADISNIILDYYSQLRDMKWTPFIDVRSGKLIWKVNKYSAKYDNIHKLLKHRKDNLRHNISIDVSILDRFETVELYNTIGTLICLKIEHYVNKYQIIIPISHLYVEYFDNQNCKYSIFYSIFGRSSLRRFDYDIYKDNHIHSSLIDIHKLGKTMYSLVFEKY